MKRPILMLFAGPNGSGKSSLVHSVLTQYPDLRYICADDIAKSVFAHIKDDEARSRQALLLAEERILALIEQRAFCAYETVLSSDYKWRILEEARRRDMLIIAYFIATKDPEINCRRVAGRTMHGGHDVPAEKIRGRYAKSIARLPKLLHMSDICFVFDNSEENTPPKELLRKNGSEIKVIPSVSEFRWIMPCVKDCRRSANYTVVETAAF